MNDFTELEADLKRLRPAPPSAGLSTRVERALSNAASATPAGGILPRRETFRINWLGLGLGLAGAATFFFLARPDLGREPRPQPTLATSAPLAIPSAAQPAHQLMPYGVTRVVYNRRDEGLVFPRDGERPVRRMRAHSFETLQWRDNGTGASLRVSYPTEEVELIPVSGQ